MFIKIPSVFLNLLTFLIIYLFSCYFYKEDHNKINGRSFFILFLGIIGCVIIPFKIGHGKLVSFACTAIMSFIVNYVAHIDTHINTHKKNASKRSEAKEMNSKKEIAIVMNKIMAKNHEIITSKKDFKIVKNIVSNNFKKNRESSFPDKNSIKKHIVKLEEKNNSLEIDTYTEYIESLKDAIEFMDSKFVELQSKTDEIFNTNKNKDLVIRFSFIHTLMEKNSKTINDLCKKIPSLQKVIDDIDNSMNVFIIESDKLKIDMEFSDFNNSNQENPYYSQLQTDLSSTSEKIAEFNKAIKEIYTM